MISIEEKYESKPRPLDHSQTLALNNLARAPHRWYFFLGVLSVAILFAWWLIQLVQSKHAYAYPLHALIMPLGVFPLFILGFTFTAGPKWLGLPSSDQLFLLNGSVYFSGLLFVLSGASQSWLALHSAGWGMMLAALSATTLRWCWLIIKSPVSDKRHAMGLLIGMIGGVWSLLCALLWSFHIPDFWRVSLHSAFAFFLLPIFLSVCHRMIPFFSANVLPNYLMWKPFSLLGLWLASSLMIGFLKILNIEIGLKIGAALALITACSFFYTSYRWRLFDTLIGPSSNRLLAMLHLSFAWLGIYFMLEAMQLMGTISSSIATHALSMGFMGSMLVGFVSRVSLGHSGRPLHVSHSLWFIYLGLHLAAILRITAGLLNLSYLLILAASLWLVLLLTWVVTMIPIYLKPRVDGQIG